MLNDGQLDAALNDARPDDVAPWAASGRRFDYNQASGRRSPPFSATTKLAPTQAQTLPGTEDRSEKGHWPERTRLRDDAGVVNDIMDQDNIAIPCQQPAVHRYARSQRDGCQSQDGSIEGRAIKRR
jgi:hypothetical protein